MGVFAVFSYSARSFIIAEQDNTRKRSETVKQSSESPTLEAVLEQTAIATHLDPATPSAPSIPSPTPGPPPIVPETPMQSATPDSKPLIQVKSNVHYFSFLSFFSRPTEEHKHALSKVHGRKKQAHAVIASSKRFIKGHSPNSTQRAKESALVVRSLIIGPSTSASPKVTATYAKPHLNQIKSQLVKAKSANKLIAQLRALPISDEDGAMDSPHMCPGPIHAVCLEHTDAEEDRLHFTVLDRKEQAEPIAKPRNTPNISSAPLDKLAEMFNQMSIVDFVKPSSLGLGQPGNGEGILSGAVPTAETVLKGLEQITPQLMALGFATGKAILPDHKGVYPPKDRMSVLTYWWGLELVLPPPTLEYLADGQSITNTVMNFLSALSLLNNGVREILPFVRYISQFIDFEFTNIRRQDKGRGVVCAATWIMPAAMVPRPWDFPDPPVPTILPIKGGDKPADPSPSKPAPPSETPVPPFLIPLPPPQIPDSTPMVQIPAEPI